MQVRLANDHVIDNFCTFIPIPSVRIEHLESITADEWRRFSAFARSAVQPVDGKFHTLNHATGATLHQWEQLTIQMVCFVPNMLLTWHEMGRPDKA